MTISDPVEAKIQSVRNAVIGKDCLLDTPFGPRPMLYADFTASGRSLTLVEDQIAKLSVHYANPHTEDSETGRVSRAWMFEAEDIIKNCVNAGPDDCVLPCGAGATDAIHKLQEILGVAIPPRSSERVAKALSTTHWFQKKNKAREKLEADSPVVFIGPYEHHSNELSWRESLAEVVTIGLNAEGLLDLDHLKRELENPLYIGRRLIGSFSAASNVTGVKTDVSALAKILHAHGAILCLDCAASAPYRRIDMHPTGDEGAHIDAICFSPHKFVGGPGSCGVLVFNTDIYRQDLPPTRGAGGTVRYVSKNQHDYFEDIKARESAGTPGVPQIVRAALAMKLQAEIGHEIIETREHAAQVKAFAVWDDSPFIEVLGPGDPDKCLGIVSFNIKDPREGYLHPRLLTVLLNDLFGIQSRAGCSCAGPYGHDLLDVDEAQSLAFRSVVMDGHIGMRPGWCRVSLHWMMDDNELDYLIRAVDFIAREGWRFVDLYSFDPVSGLWRWKEGSPTVETCFPEALLAQTGLAQASNPVQGADLYQDALSQAESLAQNLAKQGECVSGCLPKALEPVRFFTIPSDRTQLEETNPQS